MMVSPAVAFSGSEAASWRATTSNVSPARRSPAVSPMQTIADKAGAVRGERLGLDVAVALAVVGAALGMAHDHGRGTRILRASQRRCRRCGRRLRPHGSPGRRPAASTPPPRGQVPRSASPAGRSWRPRRRRSPPRPTDRARCAPRSARQPAPFIFQFPATSGRMGEATLPWSSTSPRVRFPLPAKHGRGR